MESNFSTLDWMIFSSYFLILILTSVILSQSKVKTSRDYFTGGNAMPMLAVAISVLTTSQSAATFLGGPEYSFGKDLTFLGFYASAFLAVIFVAKVLVPRFYAINAITVYEYLEFRYGETSKRYAGIMFLVGRLFASGARLYIGALAISMILFSDISASHIAISITILMLGALAYTYFGGVKSVILSDIIQAITYIGAGLAVLIYLYYSLDADFSTIMQTLSDNNKLKLVDFSFSGGFTIWTLLTGWFLLNIAAYGLDQDMTQRVLTCKNKDEGAKSLIYSIIFTIPVAMLFLFIGLLLYLFYMHPELSGIKEACVDQQFNGERITIFMLYILNEMPEGLRGLVTVGAIAAALSSTNSVLSAMASVAVEDIYRPWLAKEGRDEAHFLKVSRVMVVTFAVLLCGMAMVSFYWQQYTELPLLNFALGVMAFAYASLLGVYGAAIFTNRGSEKTVLFALIGGFMTVLLLQPYIIGQIIDIKVDFSVMMIVGTMVSFGIMMMGRSSFSNTE
ncbi:sodium:solute symporter [Sulfurovum sp. bin170]|uniref:sodium:solute symporter n=1 Tax=Sulfurovum sp. bin170 TaxID=2695268 RepID=UPI0013DFE2AE|nr:sodium:solute symporter [Sulfurovum sp. bin170]NEW61450.1 sodium:solute symporter [Sulfurovum sp. bin170]